MKAIVREADRLGIKALTLYAFSTENWMRPEGELSTLWSLLKKYLRKETENLHRENVRLRMIGQLERLSPDVRSVVDASVSRLENNTGLQLTFAVSYGGRTELARAARLFAEDCIAGKAVPSDMDEDRMADYLWTHDFGDLAEVDLVIRTSGEKRVSNFLLWQAAYAEYIFSDLYWPDFQPVHLQNAIKEFSLRERRYGGVSSAHSASLVTSSGEEVSSHSQVIV